MIQFFEGVHGVLKALPAVEKDEELGFSSQVRAVFIGEHAEKRFLFHKLSVDPFDLPLVAVREDGHDDHVGPRMVQHSKLGSFFLHFSSGQVQMKSDLYKCSFKTRI